MTNEMQHTQGPLARLRHHVTGSIERGESVAIVEQSATSRTILTPSEPWPFLQAPLNFAKTPARRKRAKKLPDALL